MPKHQNYRPRQHQYFKQSFQSSNIFQVYDGNTLYKRSFILDPWARLLGTEPCTVISSPNPIPNNQLLQQQQQQQYQVNTIPSASGTKLDGSSFHNALNALLPPPQQITQLLSTLPTTNE